MSLDIRIAKKIINEAVKWNGQEWILNACILRRYKDGSGWYYEAELLDKNKNSVVIVDLNAVKERTE